MKKTLICISITLFFLLFHSCIKGENMSKRIVGGWKMDKYLVGLEDSSQTFHNRYKNYIISFFEDHTYTESYVDSTNNLQGNVGQFSISLKGDSLFLLSGNILNSYQLLNLNSNALNIKKVVNSGSQENTYLYKFVRK